MIKSYRFMPLASVLKYVPEMQRLGVSEVARSRNGFIGAYKRAGSSEYLSESWKIKRNAFIARMFKSYKINQKKGLKVTRQRLSLIAWGFNPDKE
jgi:hypothetical protein